MMLLDSTAARSLVPVNIVLLAKTVDVPVFNRELWGHKMLTKLRHVVSSIPSQVRTREIYHCDKLGVNCELGQSAWCGWMARDPAGISRNCVVR
jgi:hypothetical protein